MSDIEQEQVEDPNDSRRYFAQVHNMIDDFGLSPYAYRLYGAYKRSAGASNGVCKTGTRKLAAKCHMSTGEVINSKKELVIAGLIYITEVSSPHGTIHHIRMAELWDYNNLIYANKPTPDQVSIRMDEVKRSLSEHPLQRSSCELMRSNSERLRSSREQRNNSLGITSEEDSMESPLDILGDEIDESLKHAKSTNAISRTQIEDNENSVASEEQNDDQLEPDLDATPHTPLTTEPMNESTPKSSTIPQKSVRTESVVAANTAVTWKVGDKVRYTTRGGWDGGTDIHCIAQIVKVNKKKTTIVVYNVKNSTPQELSVSPSHLTTRNTTDPLDEQLAAHISAKKKKPGLPPTYGDLFVAYREKVYHADADSPEATQLRVGKDAKLLIVSFPDANAVELKDFVKEWTTRKVGADVPRGATLVGWFDTYRKEWKKSRVNSEQVTYTSVEIDMSVSGSEAL